MIRIRTSIKYIIQYIFITKNSKKEEKTKEILRNRGFLSELETESKSESGMEIQPT